MSDHPHEPHEPDDAHEPDDIHDPDAPDPARDDLEGADAGDSPPVDEINAKSGGRGQRLEGKQDAAILALLSQPSIAKAAEAAKVGLRTLHRWLNEDQAFIAAYRRARRDVFGHAVALTQRYAAMAVQTLAKVMTDATAPHAARVSAASALLRFGREGIELEDLQERLQRLEERVGEGEAWKGGSLRL